MKLKKIKLGRLFSVISKVLPFALIAAVIFATAFYPQSEKNGMGEEIKRVVRVWNVDTFEGGKGSRTNFLKRAAAKAEKKRTGVYYLVSSYTQEGIARAFADGQRPDVLSFGIGVSAYLEHSLPLPYSFSGGEAKGECYAYPWCRGEYYVFSLKDDFSESGETVISSGGSNLVEVAAALQEISGTQIDSLSAYVAFLNGNYRYLLGTQRDVCRFSSRGVNVYRKPLSQFCDLYQYISVLSAEKRDDCFVLVESLLSEETQKELDTIGMLPAQGGDALKTVSAFMDGESLDSLREAAKGDSTVKNLDKFLKNI